MNFDDAFLAVLGAEGRYSNNPADPGGETMWGITVAVARENGYTGPMKDMPISEAKRIYKLRYWDQLRADQLPFPVARLVFDCAVNMGVHTAVMLMQRCLGVSTDGIIGPVTLATAQAFDPARFCAHFNAARIDYYCSLPTFGTFGKGWMHRVAEQLRTA